jgi:hypothetical protein
MHVISGTLPLFFKAVPVDRVIESLRFEIEKKGGIKVNKKKTPAFFLCSSMIVVVVHPNP